MNLLFTRFILIPFKINVNLKILELKIIFGDRGTVLLSPFSKMGEGIPWVCVIIFFLATTYLYKIYLIRFLLKDHL